MDRKYLQPIIKVLSKCPLFDHRNQITMGGCNHPNIYLVRVVAPESFEFLFLQDSEQLRLKLQRDVAYFIQKESTLIRQFKAPSLAQWPL